MKWSLLELRRYQDQGLTFSEELDLKAELTARDSEILDAESIQVSGNLVVSSSEYIVYLKIKAPLVLPSARSLTPVPVTLAIEVEEVYMTLEQFEKRHTSIPDEEIFILDKDMIDLKEAVVDNILLNIPMQVFTPEELSANELPKGSQWEVISQDTYIARQTSEKTEVDPRLAKLADLFPKEEEE